MIRLDGKLLAQEMQESLAKKVEQMKVQYHVVPKLVVILVGEDSASKVYVANKEKSAIKAGFESVVERLSADITESDLLQIIEKYNQDTATHGILVQLPLPKHLDSNKILNAIDYHKDVDGFHPMNVGNFVLNNSADNIIPCTPYGIVKIIEKYQFDLTGKVAVVVGRSNIVGKPMINLLLQKNATVIATHSYTKDLSKWTKQADILIVAIGKGEFIKKADVNPNAIVIDVGMNRDENGKLVGDVSRDVADNVYALTPVPGGVGPMTITMLLEQTYDNALRLLKK